MFMVDKSVLILDKGILRQGILYHATGYIVGLLYV